MNNQSFSKRHGFKASGGEIIFRHEAPEELRNAIIQIAYQLDFNYKDLREAVCDILLKTPNYSGNWTEIPNVRDEVLDLIHNCNWFKVYDIAEYLYRYIKKMRHLDDANDYQERLNDFFIECGYGWNMVNGIIIARGEESIEKHIERAKELLDKHEMNTAKREINEAINDISKRPDPDITGAIQHSLAGLECVCREITGDKKATLGKILNINPDLFPIPLEKTAESIWGYASEMGRHIREGREPEYEESELMVGLCSVLIVYLLSKKE